MTRPNVVIVGGGIAGASLGAALGDRARVTILEAEAHCGAHSTGRSAAFWLASYGGPGVAPLTLASHDPLEAGWPTGERSWLSPRGAFHLVRAGTLWDGAAAVEAADSGARWVDRRGLEAILPGLRDGWVAALSEPGCADIDVAGLHAACLAAVRRSGGTILTNAPLTNAVRVDGEWRISAGEHALTADILVNAAGAWADNVARRCGAAPLGIVPHRRTMLQLRVDNADVAHLPLINDSEGHFYFKGESPGRIWLTPHDETACDPCDAAPEEIDVATAIDRFQSVVDWRIEAVERRWAGLRSFAPDRLPAIGFDPALDCFFWCAGQGGFGIQTAPAAASLAAALLLGETVAPDAGLIPTRFSPGRFST